MIGDIKKDGRIIEDTNIKKKENSVFIYFHFCRCLSVVYPKIGDLKTLNISSLNIKIVVKEPITVSRSPDFN